MAGQTGTEGQMGRHTDGQMDGHMARHRQVHGRTAVDTDRQTHGQRHTERNRHTDTHTEVVSGHTCSVSPLLYSVDAEGPDHRGGSSW